MKAALSSRSITLATSLGILGAAILVLSYAFFTPGKFLLVPYAVVVLGTCATIRAEGIRKYWECFWIGLVAFILASVALYIAVAISVGSAQLSVGGHAWRLAFLVGIGAVINVVTARVSQSPLQARTA